MQIQPPGPGRALDLSHDEWTEVFHLRPRDVVTNDDVVHSDEVERGFRLSTTVMPADKPGGKPHQSATAHFNFDRDRITMYDDGTSVIEDESGEEFVDDGPGTGAMMSGGERFGGNANGTLSITADAAHERWVGINLRGTGDGVDVTIDVGKSPLYDSAAAANASS